MMDPKYRRDQWLKNYNFTEDPFSPESIRAEADKLLEDSTFVEFPYYENIKGQIETPGPDLSLLDVVQEKLLCDCSYKEVLMMSYKKGTGLVLALTYNHFDRVYGKLNMIRRKLDQNIMLKR